MLTYTARPILLILFRPFCLWDKVKADEPLRIKVGSQPNCLVMFINVNVLPINQIILGLICF